MYNEDEYLLLSGIQHFYFCKRQWALIHLENRWSENESTMLGNLLHEKADKPYIKEKRRDIKISRAMPVASSSLGLTGILDVVEFQRDEKGVSIPGEKGLWYPNVIEYKKGKPKKDNRDIVQLVAQIMILEEDFKISIDHGYLYYFKTKEKVRVDISQSNRQQIFSLTEKMHGLYRSKKIPKGEFYKNCRLCSLVDICMPRITKKKRSIENYLYGD